MAETSANRATGTTRPGVAAANVADHSSDDNVQVSAFQQWKLVIGKTGKFMWRDTSMSFCIIFAPSVIILGMSLLVLIGGSEDYDASMYTTSTLRDGQFATSVYDHKLGITAAL